MFIKIYDVLNKVANVHIKICNVVSLYDPNGVLVIATRKEAPKFEKRLAICTGEIERLAMRTIIGTTPYLVEKCTLKGIDYYK